MAAERILIVDDNPQNLKLARVLLLGAGYDVSTAVDAEEALRLLEQSESQSPATLPHLILMDIQLPGIDGLDLTRRLKADERRRGIVIVALTAYAMKGDEEKAYAAGCDGYIAKPINIEELPKTIARLIAAAAAAAAATATATAGNPVPESQAPSS